MRQGAFNSRYSSNLGRINTLIYGSKYLYTNEDLSGSVSGNSLVKVGGQEFIVDDYQHTVTVDSAIVSYAPYSTAETAGDVVADPSKSFRLTLSEPFLGTSIIPVLTDTGAVAAAINTGGANDNTGAASRGYTATVAGANAHNFPDPNENAFTKATTSTDYVQLVTATVTTANTDSLVSGNDLFVQGCPITSMQNQVKMVPAQAYLEIFHSECQIDFTNGGNNPVYRRSDDPANQNLYAASTDTAAWAAQSYCFMRGSTMVYPCSYRGITDVITGSSTGPGGAVTKDTNVAGIDGTGANHPFVFLDNLGPYKTTASDATAVAIVATAQADFTQHWTAATYTGLSGSIYGVIDDGDNVAAGSVMLINGRRYKVAAAQDTTALTHGGIALSETFAGSEYLELCSSCVSAVTDVADSESTITVGNNWGFGFDLTAGDQIMVGENTHFDGLMSVTTAFNGGEVGGTITASSGAGASPAIAAASTTGAFVSSQTGATSALYKVLNTNGYTPILVTESAVQTTYQYVSQCSNRGACDGSTGICACFKGYTNDNCDTQNMLAA